MWATVRSKKYAIAHFYQSADAIIFFSHFIFPFHWVRCFYERTYNSIIFLQKKYLFSHWTLQSIAHVTSPKSYLFRLPINLVIRNTQSQPIVKMTAKEFMMGYESPLTTLGNNLLPHWIHFDKVGLIDRVSEMTDIYLYINLTTFSSSHLLSLSLSSDVRFQRWFCNILHGWKRHSNEWPLRYFSRITELTSVEAWAL